jgi:hypothetical protein
MNLVHKEPTSMYKQLALKHVKTTFYQTAPVELKKTTLKQLSDCLIEYHYQAIYTNTAILLYRNTHGIETLRIVPNFIFGKNVLTIGYGTGKVMSVAMEYGVELTEQENIFFEELLVQIKQHLPKTPPK